MGSYMNIIYSNKEVIIYFLFLQRAKTADLKILIADLSLLSETITPSFLLNPKFTPSDLAKTFLSSNLEVYPSSSSSNLTDSATSVFSEDNTIVVFNKMDLLSEEYMRELKTFCDNHRMKICWMSCKTSDGIEIFMHQMKDMLKDM